MRILFLLGLLVLTASAVSPAIWRITLNGKTLLVTSSENAEKNKVKITKTELLKKGPLAVSYTEKKLEKGWKREISVVDSGENELVERGNNKVTISDKEIRKILDKGITTIHIYSWTLPTDPKKAALVRVRRVHLCTIIIT